MEQKKMVFETPEQIKEYFISQIKSGKKIKEEEVMKMCYSIFMSDEEMADLIDEILSVEVEPEDDIDFTATDEDGLNVELLLEDDVFLDEDTSFPVLNFDSARRKLIHKCDRIENLKKYEHYKKISCVFSTFG